jgi:hypothetical protein
MKIFSKCFNGRREPFRISVGINDSGRTVVYLPDMPEPFIVIEDYPIEIDISGNGPGPDVAILVEVTRGRGDL